MPTRRNYMEDCAVKTISKMIIEKNIPGAKFDDIIADALNRLPVKYVVSRKGELYSKIGTIETQFNVDIISAGVAAIEDAAKEDEAN
ncbi:MAG: late competence development ComFB family protein [Firmicutes bacterium]|nr:late competence development ComFB family protein [Bacillota bacterium]